MDNLFTEISLIILVATLVAILMRIIKQPLIMGYIITGFILGPKVLNLITSFHTIEAFSKFGVAILLFIVGLGLSPKILREVGKIALITGLGQIVFTTLFGYLISIAFGYSVVSSLYISIALTFSSTIIVSKLLMERGDTEKLYSRIAIGFLLVQDLVATFILLFVSTLATPNATLETLVLVLLKGFLALIILFFVSSKFLPKLSGFFASSGELLFLFSIGWGLGFAILFYYIGFSLEIGALLAGLTLSVTPYNQEIGSKLKPLRDFFLVMFFVLLGAKFVIGDLASITFQASIYSAFVLVGNPFIVLIMMNLLGYNKKTSFFSGLTVAQISEFSLILALLGVEQGHIDQQTLSLITLVGIITITGSSYLIIYAHLIYDALKDYLGIFEHKKTKREFDILSSYEVILFGCNRVGYDFIETFKHLGQGLLCIDYDPKTIKQLTKEGINCRYGDAEDLEFLDEVNVTKAKMVISTIPDFDANMFLLNMTKKNPKVIVIVISYNIEDSLKLYESGADYVILPHFLGGRVVADLAKSFSSNMKKLNLEKNKHLDYLNRRVALGHTHPGRIS